MSPPESMFQPPAPRETPQSSCVPGSILTRTCPLDAPRTPPKNHAPYTPPERSPPSDLPPIIPGPNPPATWCTHLARIHSLNTPTSHSDAARCVADWSASVIPKTADHAASWNPWPDPADKHKPDSAPYHSKAKNDYSESLPPNDNAPVEAPPEPVPTALPHVARTPTPAPTPPANQSETPPYSPYTSSPPSPSAPYDPCRYGKADHPAKAPC